MSTTTPLFASDRPSSVHSEERAGEEDALLGNQRKSTGTSTSRVGFWRELGLLVWAALSTAAVIVLAVLFQHKSQAASKDGTSRHAGKRNLVFMVSDGMGPASLSLTRSFRQYQEHLPIDDVLVLDRHFIGSSRTRSSSSLVTDSAAGATAFSCGKKSYNGAISILPDHTPCGTVLEAAKRAGYMTGLVVTTSITDATPACFASHVHIRSEEDLIAQQEVGLHPLGRVLDLMLGGGRCHFLPNTTRGGCRADEWDITKLAREEYGWSYVDSRKEFDDLNAAGGINLPFMGLFADTDFPFEIDRRTQDETYPSLEEMAKTALYALEAATKNSDKGFFLMIEGSRIDHAGHGNDPAAQVHEVLAYDKAFAAVLEFLEKSNDGGVLIATSDHETGGLSTAKRRSIAILCYYMEPPRHYSHQDTNFSIELDSVYPEYLWHPEVLANASHSAEYLSKKLNDEFTAELVDLGRDLKQHINATYMQEGLGIFDASDAELQLIIDHPPYAVYYFANMISQRAQVGWSTHGHSAVDVNIYGTIGSHNLSGNNENTDVGNFLREYLNVDIDEVTKELVEKSKSFDILSDSRNGWTGKLPSELDLQSISRHNEALYGKAPR